MKFPVLILITFLLTSCTCIVKDKFNKFNYNNKNIICRCNKIIFDGQFEEDIRQYRKDCLNYKYLYGPVLVKKGRNSIGLYQYWPFTLDISTDHFFIYDGEKIEFVDNENLSYLEKWLTDNGFNKKKIRKVICKMNECIEFNKTHTGSF